MFLNSYDVQLCIRGFVLGAESMAANREVEEQLDTVRDTKFLKGPEEVVLYRVFAEPQFAGDRLVRLSLRCALHNLQFTYRKFRRIVREQNVGIGNALECFKQRAGLSFRCPDEPLRDMPDAVEKFLHRPVS